MKRRILSFSTWILLTLAVLLGTVTAAKADTGPKPSVTVTLENLPEGTAYATLLSKTKSTGPYSAGVSYEDHFGSKDASREIWEAFDSYAQQDDYYFIGFVQNVTVSGTLSWTYYPPQDFKLLIYLPESNTFLISEAESRYAFDSLYTADCSLSPITFRSSLFTLSRLTGFAGRLLFTLAIELFVALLFNLREKEQKKVIILMNLATQIVLNLILMKGPSLNFHRLGLNSWSFLFILCEIGVFAAEAFVYTKKLEDVYHSKKQLILYAFLANLASMVFGLFFNSLFPSLY